MHSYLPVRHVFLCCRDVMRRSAFAAFVDVIKSESTSKRKQRPRTRWAFLFSLSKDFMTDQAVEPKLAAAPKETKAQRSERLKLAKNPWEAWDEVREYAKGGRDTVAPDWANLYFKWWGVYTQGDGLGVTGGVGGEGKVSEYFMMRIGMPNGLLTSHQARVIGQLTQKHARNLADITTRQNIQLPLASPSAPSVGNCRCTSPEIGLSPKGACGDVTRNVTGCPVIAGLQPAR